MKHYPKLFFILFLNCFFLQATFAQNPIIHLPFNGNTNDISGNGLNGTGTAITATTDRFGTANSAYEFNGSTSNVMLPYNNIYNFSPSGQFTISLWLLPYNANSICALLAKSEFHSNFYMSLWNYGLYLVNNKGMSGYANTNFLNGYTTLSANACWHHLAVSYNNGIWVLYVDGVIEAEDYSQTKFITQTVGAPIGIGRKGASSGDYFNGKLDDIRVYNVALSYSQIKSQLAYAGSDTTICYGSSVQLSGVGGGTASWSPSTGLSNPNVLNPTANPTATTTYILTLTQGSCVTRDTVVVTVQNCCFTCGTTNGNVKSGLVACYAFDGNANDGSGFNNHGTVYNATPTTDRFGRANSAYYFNGTSARIQVPHAASINNPLITITAWVNYGSTATSQIVTKRNWSNAANEQFAFDTKDFYVKRNGGCTANVGWNSVNYTSPPALGTWTFVAVTYDGRYSKFYKNGVLQNTADFGSNVNMDICGGGELIFGATWSSFPFYYTGKIDDVRIYNRALSATEINQVYTWSNTATGPTANAGTDIDICPLDSFQLNGSGIGYPSWLPSLPLSNPNILNPKGKVGSSTAFILINSIGSCEARDTVFVNAVNPIANAGSDQSICSGDSATLSANGGPGTFSWTPTTGMTGSTTLNPKVKVTVQTDFIFTRTYGSCVNRDTVRVNINNPAMSAGNDTAICSGSSVQLMASGAGTPSWSPSAGLSNPNVLSPVATPTSTTLYVLTLTQGSCVVKDTVVVAVQNCCFNCSTPQTKYGNSLIACYAFDGSAADGSGNANHGTVYGASLTTDRFGRANSAYFFNGSSYILVPNSSSLSSAGNNLTITFWSKVSSWVMQSGVNYASAISKSNTGAECSFRYSLTPDGASVIHNGKLWNYTPGGMSNALNQWEFFSATVSGNTLKIYKNGVLYGTTTTSSPFTFDNNNPLQIGRDFPGVLDYFNGSIDDIRIYNSTLTDQQVYELFVLSNTMAAPTVNAGSNIIICQSDSFQLAGSGNGIMSWSPAGPLANAGLLNTKGKVSGNTDFILSNQFGSCLVRDTVNVNTDGVTANAGPDRQICKREVIVVAGSGNGNSYSWSPIKNISNNLSATPSVNPDTTTTYILTVTAGTCVARDTMTVFVNPLDVQIANADTLVCPGDTITLRGSSNGSNYIWSPTTDMINSGTLSPKVFPQNPVKYYIEISDANCHIKDSVSIGWKTINVYAGEDTVICEGDTIQLQGIGPVGSSYLWAPVSSLDQAMVYNPKAFPAASTTYILKVNQGKCFALDTLLVKVDTKPIVSAGADVKYCFGEMASLNASVSNATSYVWSPASGLSDTKVLNPDVFGSGTRLYVLTAQNGKCLLRDTVQAKEYPQVIASFGASPENAIIPATIEFTDKSTNASFYQWNFNDNGASSSAKNPQYIYTKTGNYKVWLKVTDSLGCADSASVEIVVTDVPYLQVPNVFTPDGDMLNDSFKVVFNESAFEILTYRIYNRWGGFMYESSFPDGKWWDGTFNGKSCPDGVYFYIIYAKAYSGREFNLSGTVTLLR